MIQMKHLMITAFGAVLLAPNLLFPLMKTEADLENRENRTLAPFPSVSWENIDSLPADIELYINDHAAFRNRFLSLNSSLNLALFDHADSREVIKGKDGWYFYAAGSSVEDFLGVNRFSPEELSAITEKLLAAQAYFEQRGVRFLVLIAPNKEGIYREYLPDGFASPDAPTRREELIQAVKSRIPGLIADPSAYFMENRDYQWYFKTDTHWNDAAGFVAAQMLIEMAGGSPVAIEDIQIEYMPGKYGDLASLFHMPESLADDSAAFIRGYYDELPVEFSDPAGDGNIVRYTSPESPDPRRIAIYRDSFGVALAPALCKYFRFADFYHRQVFDCSLLEENKPDIVVYEIVERNLDQILWDLGRLTGE